MSKLNNISYSTIPLRFFLFISPISVCTILFGNIGVYSYFLVAISSFLVLSSRKFKLDNWVLYASLLFFLPILLSYINAFLNFFYYNNLQYESYFISDMPMRLVNCLAFYTIFVYGHIYIKYQTSAVLTYYLRLYSCGVFTFLGFFGIWQILNILLGVWIPEVATRGNIHSIESSNLLAGFFRVTSLANEPSYLVPFLLDAILLLFYLNKKVLSVILVFVLLFSLSLGGYVNAFALLLFSIYLLRDKIEFNKYLLFVCFVLFILVLVLGKELNLLLNIVLSRQELSDGFDVSESGRIEMVVMPWKFLFEGNPLSFLFGNGPGSFEYLSLVKKMNSGDAYHSTSNCLYTDIIYEGGLVSFIGIIFFFIKIWQLFNKIKTSVNFKTVLIGKLLLVHILISSFYRADFMAPRFWAMILVINITYQLALIKYKCKRSFSDVLPL